MTDSDTGQRMEHMIKINIVDKDGNEIPLQDYLEELGKRREKSLAQSLVYQGADG